MSEQVDIEFLSKEFQHSDFDWANINVGNERVGKARCLIDGNTLTIYSINVFPEYEGNGYGRLFCEVAKQRFNTVIADRVRHTAVGFWEKMGFEVYKDGAWIYRKS